MKNKVFLFCFILAAISPAFAQDSKFRLGIRFAPNLSFNRVEDVDDTDGLAFESNGLGLRFSAGIFGDFFFGKNYAFHTGLWYSVKRAGLKYTSTGNVKGNGLALYNLQELQIPLALKLFTNDIATDTRLYFTLGGTAGIKINEKRLEWTSQENSGEGKSAYFDRPGIGKAFTFGDFGLLLGIGAEYRMAENTTLFGGIIYNRGLMDVPSQAGLFQRSGKDASDYYVLNNQSLGIEIGIKF